jgi:hypothetical protein
MNALRDNLAPSSMALGLFWTQGLYFLITGVWPIVSVQSFQLVTGPKSDHLIVDSPTDADHWMLFTISALIIAISIAILAAAWRRRLPLEICLLGIARPGPKPSITHGGLLPRSRSDCRMNSTVAEDILPWAARTSRETAVCSARRPIAISTASTILGPPG